VIYFLADHPDKAHQADEGTNALLSDQLSLLDNQAVRWTAARKAQVVSAVSLGLLTEQDVLQRFSISSEEIADWRRRLLLHGFRGLQGFRELNRRDQQERNEQKGQDCAK
jgi:hypothetical protein